MVGRGASVGTVASTARPTLPHLHTYQLTFVKTQNIFLTTMETFPTVTGTQHSRPATTLAQPRPISGGAYSWSISESINEESNVNQQHQARPQHRNALQAVAAGLLLAWGAQASASVTNPVIGQL